MYTYYIGSVFGTVFAMLIMVIGAQSNGFLEKRRKKYFQLLFIMLIIVNVSELLAALTMAKYFGEFNYLRFLFYGAKFIEFTVSPVIPIVAMQAIGTKINIKIPISVISFNCILQIVSIFTGCVFFLDSNNQYHRSVLYPVYVVVFVLSFIYMIVGSFHFCRDYQIKNLTFLIMMLILACIAMLLPFLMSNLRLDWVFLSLAAMLFYIFYEHLIVQSDELTRLLNRSCWESFLNIVNEDVILYTVDVNNFKNVNDQYGHLYGDECLRITGSNLRKVFGKYGNCYRVGGDEFCVAQTKNLDQVELLIHNFEELTKLTMEKDPRFPSCAIGYTFFDVKTDSIQDALKLADENMYKNKNDMKNHLK